MKICSRYNLTILSGYDIKSLSSNYLFFVDKDGYPSGKYGNYIGYKIFGDYKNAKKFCKILYTEEIGNYFKDNKTYTHSMKLIAQSKGDLLFKPLDYQHTETGDLLSFTNILGSISVTTLQIIDDKKILIANNLIDLLNYLIPSSDFIISLLLSIIFYSLCIILILKFNDSKFRKLAIIIMAFLFSIFLSFINSFYNSNLNTSEIIVNTEDLLDSLDKILDTKKEVCLSENSSEFDYFTKATNENSIAFRIYNKMNKSNPCFLAKNGKLDQSIFNRELINMFYLNNDVIADVTSRVIQTAIKKDTFSSQVILFESLRGLIVNRNLKEEVKRHINKWTDFMFHHGFLVNLFNNFPNFSDMKFVKIGGKDGFVNYKSVSEYIDANTNTIPLSYDKLEPLFRIYFVFLIVILIVYLINIFRIYLRFLLIKE